MPRALAASNGDLLQFLAALLAWLVRLFIGRRKRLCRLLSSERIPGKLRRIVEQTGRT